MVKIWMFLMFGSGYWQKSFISPALTDHLPYRYYILIKPYFSLMKDQLVVLTFWNKVKRGFPISLVLC